MKPIQEKRFEYKGLPCVILFMPMGYRCGYVGLPKGIKVEVNEIDCHCGITYTGNHLHFQEDTDRFWIGFDCGHCCDGFDVKTAKELFAEDVDVLRQIEILGITGYFGICNEENPVRTLEYCEEQCKRIVEQIEIQEVSMGDCMSYPDKAIDFIKGYSFKDKQELYTNGSELVPMFRVEQMLEHYFPRWIPVSERLPVENWVVLVQVSGKPMSNISLHDALELASHNQEDGWILETYPEWEGVKPVAWMPLPEPYESEEDRERLRIEEEILQEAAEYEADLDSQEPGLMPET